MKKVLVISNIYPSKKEPFHGTFVRNFVDDLEQRQNVEKIDICVIRGRSYQYYLYKKIYRYTTFYVKIIYRLMFYHYDLVYVHVITHAALPLRIISCFKKLPLVFNIHGEDVITQTKLAEIFLRIVTPLLIHSKLIVVPSFFFKQKVELLLPDIPTSKLYVSPSGGIKEFFYQSFRRKNKKKIPVLGYVSRIDRGKGWDTFLDSLKILEQKGIQVHARLIGTGAEVDKMKRQIVELQLKEVEYWGGIAYEQLPEVYVDFDLFIFPTKLEESLGLVGLEAMACCTPVIASHIGGLTDYVKSGINGFFFEAGNANSLASKICCYLESSDEEKNILQEQAYKTALSYKSDIVSDMLLKKIEL